MQEQISPELQAILDEEDDTLSFEHQMKLAQNRGFNGQYIKSSQHQHMGAQKMRSHGNYGQYQMKEMKSHNYEMEAKQSRPYYEYNQGGYQRQMN